MNATCGTSIMYHPQDKEGNNVLYVFVCIIIVKILWQRVSNSNLISVFSHKKSWYSYLKRRSSQGSLISFEVTLTHVSSLINRDGSGQKTREIKIKSISRNFFYITFWIFYIIFHKNSENVEYPKNSVK